MTDPIEVQIAEVPTYKLNIVGNFTKTDMGKIMEQLANILRLPVYKYGNSRTVNITSLYDSMPTGKSSKKKSKVKRNRNTAERIEEMKRLVTQEPQKFAVVYKRVFGYYPPGHSRKRVISELVRAGIKVTEQGRTTYLSAP
jgi:hypothetical protein